MNKDAIDALRYYIEQQQGNLKLKRQEVDKYRALVADLEEDLRMYENRITGLQQALQAIAGGYVVEDITDIDHVEEYQG